MEEINPYPSRENTVTFYGPAPGIIATIAAIAAEATRTLGLGSFGSQR